MLLCRLAREAANRLAAAAATDPVLVVPNRPGPAATEAPQPHEAGGGPEPLPCLCEDHHVEGSSAFSFLINMSAGERSEIGCFRQNSA